MGGKRAAGRATVYQEEMMGDEDADDSSGAHTHTNKEQQQDDEQGLQQKQHAKVKEEHVCVVCMGLLIPPVVLPCAHRVCEECFRRIEDLSNMECPMCRRRLHSWCRKLRGGVVDQRLWAEMRRLYPKQCESHSKDLGALEDEVVRPHRPRLASEGEVRAEYEAELAKIKAEIDAEEAASMRAIKELAQTDEEVKRQLEEEERVKRDAEYARRLMEAEKREQQRLAQLRDQAKQQHPKQQNQEQDQGDVQATHPKAVEAVGLASPPSVSSPARNPASHRKHGSRQRPALRRSHSATTRREQQPAKRTARKSMVHLPQRSKSAKQRRRRTLEHFLGQMSSTQTTVPLKGEDAQAQDGDSHKGPFSPPSEPSSSSCAGVVSTAAAATAAAVSRMTNRDDAPLQPARQQQTSPQQQPHSGLPTYTTCPLCFKRIHNDCIRPHAASCTGQPQQ